MLDIIVYDTDKQKDKWALDVFILAIIKMGVKVTHQVVTEYIQTPEVMYGSHQNSGKYTPPMVLPSKVSLICESEDPDLISYCRFQLTDEK